MKKQQKMVRSRKLKSTDDESTDLNIHTIFKLKSMKMQRSLFLAAEFVSVTCLKLHHHSLSLVTYPADLTSTQSDIIVVFPGRLAGGSQEDLRRKSGRSQEDLRRKSGGSQEEVRRISGGSLEDLRRKSGGSQEALRISGGSLEDLWRISGGILEDLRRKSGASDSASASAE
ncbi:unnamed protein product [Pleuronectes platessa]|uniref:Uncharacterized protein n=1 Tax=Pleuronectes platessa TaxID=8262 RepID=A0A9N7UE32_PLEPL|nr:unnamed protein product [Pleuronectes platessa]